jgi:hypothetical protein
MIMGKLVSGRHEYMNYHILLDAFTGIALEPASESKTARTELKSRARSISSLLDFILSKRGLRNLLEAPPARDRFRQGGFFGCV